MKISRNTYSEIYSKFVQLALSRAKNKAIVRQLVKEAFNIPSQLYNVIKLSKDGRSWQARDYISVKDRNTGLNSLIPGTNLLCLLQFAKHVQIRFWNPAEWLWVNSRSHGKAPVVVPAGEHKLQYAYCLWFSHRSPGKKASVQDYDQNLKLIGRFASVEQFWALYSHIPRPSELQSPSDFHLFKAGIKPMWEDEANQKGGKWIVRLRKGLASRCWENLVLAMLGEQFMVGDEICGAVVSIRFQEDIISIWNKSASDTSTKGRIKDTLSRVLNLPPSTIVEYKTHSDSLKDVFTRTSSEVVSAETTS